jgi:hypothetical protein
MLDVRALISGCLDFPHVLDRVSDEQDLVLAGVTSAEMIRIALRCEQHMGRALTDGELDRLTSLKTIAECLRTAGSA